VKPARVLVPIPVELALVNDGRGWEILPAPPEWWLEELSEAHPESAGYRSETPTVGPPAMKPKRASNSVPSGPPTAG
jgi:hypothetical protein